MQEIIYVQRLQMLQRRGVPRDVEQLNLVISDSMTSPSNIGGCLEI
jgi:hypothetical protein